MQESIRDYATGKADPEELHRLRVAIKKVRAVLEMIDFREKAKVSKSTRKKLRDLFRAAGQIRNLEVMRELLKTHHISPRIISIRNKRPAEKLSGNFIAARPGYEKIIRRAEKNINRKIKRIREKHVVAFLSDREKAARKKLAKADPATLHEDRKLLKQIIYLDPISDKPVKQHRLYDNLQEKIGNWHDIILLTGLLKKNTSPQAKKVLLRIKREALHDLTGIKKTARKLA